MQAMSIESPGSMVQEGATLNFWSVHVARNLLEMFLKCSGKNDFQ